MTVTPTKKSRLSVAVLGSLLVQACAAGGARPHTSTTRPVAAIEYDVRVGADLDLVVTAGLPEGTSELTLDDAALPFVGDVAVVEPGGRRPVPRGGRSYRTACSARCRVEYRFSLRAAGAAVADVDTAIVLGDVVVAPPSTWLLRPSNGPGGRYRFRVETAGDVSFATGVRALNDGVTHEGDLADIGQSPFSVFGEFRTLSVGKGTTLAVASDVPLSDEDVAAWISKELAAVAAYYGRAPDDPLLVIVAKGTSEVNRGKTLGGGGASILVRLGTATTAAALADDWVVAHELVHVGFPRLGYEHGWFSEGVATYVEPVARARSGLVSAEHVFGDLFDSAPEGLPKSGDRGLEGSEEWGRVYWGGAVFFLMADVEIRARTFGRRSLDDAIRAVAATGATVETEWTLDRVLEVGDRATGTTVLHDFYAKYAAAPGVPDLAALWSRLGVHRTTKNKGVELDDSAPGAAIRRAITAGDARERAIDVKNRAL